MQSNDNPTLAEAQKARAPTSAGAPATALAKPPKPRQDEPMIPVQKIAFMAPTDCLGGANAKDALVAMPREKVLDAEGKRVQGTEAWLIDYLPRIQHVRITYYPPGNGSKPEQHRFVPVSALRSWDPVP